MISRINGGSRNGGYTLRLKAGTNELNGEEALALARTRKNDCRPQENDRSRAIRQQKIMNAIKDKVTSFETFVRLPWVSWAAPKAVRSDMSGPTLLGLIGAELIGGESKKFVLEPTGRLTLPDGGAGLTVDDATKQQAVERFLEGLSVPGRPVGRGARGPLLDRAADGRLSSVARAARGSRRPGERRCGRWRTSRRRGSASTSSSNSPGAMPWPCRADHVGRLDDVPVTVPVAGSGTRACPAAGSARLLHRNTLMPPFERPCAEVDVRLQ